MNFVSRITRLVHRPRWHVFVLFAIIFVPVALYGAISVPLRHHQSWGISINCFEQGWPFPYIEGTADWRVTPSNPFASGGYFEEVEDWRIIKSNLNVWQRLKNIKKLHVGKLFANLVIIGIIAGVPTLLWHVHTVRHRKPWQFSIREMLAAMALVAVVFSVWSYYETQYQAEQKAKIELEKIGWYFSFSGEPDLLPYALWRPFHDFNIPVPRCCFDRSAWITWDAEGFEYDRTSRLDKSRWNNVNEMLCEVGQRLRLFPYCVQIEIWDQDLDDSGAFAVFSGMNNECDHVSVYGSLDLTNEGIKCILRTFPDLNWLSLRKTGMTDQIVPYLDAADIGGMVIYHAPLLTPDGQRRIARLKIDNLVIPEDWKVDSEPQIK